MTVSIDHKKRLEVAYVAPLRSITVYNGWLILEYPETVKGKPESRFAVQQPPHGPIQAGNSLNQAKQAIDGRRLNPPRHPPGCKAATKRAGGSR